MQQFERQGKIQGCRVARNAPPVSHLFFGDNSFLFFKAKLEECEAIKNRISLHEEASGQSINFQKSSILYSSNVNDDLASAISEFFSIEATDNHGLYLGSPSLVGRKQKQVFEYLKDKFWSRLNRWRKKFLSKAGKEILVKTVAQALPVYTMSVFLIPLELCTELECMMNSFFWVRDKEKGKGINWLSWNRLCVDKEQGGLSFRRLNEFNKAKLGKSAWRLLSNPNSLLARVYKAKYYPHSDYLNASIGSNPSYIWRSVWSVQNVSGRWQLGEDLGGSLVAG